MECQREMGGGGHLMGAPINWKEGFLGLVVGQTALGTGMAGMDRQVQMW